MHNHKQHSTLFVVLSVGVLLFSCLAYYLFVTEPWASKDATKLGDDAQVKVSDKRSVPDVESHSKARGQQKVASSPKTPSPVPPPASFISALKNRVLNEFVPINNGTLTISTVDAFNNLHLAPRLQSITDMDYFRFVKLNLKNKCTLWPDNTKDCSIQFCEEADIPESFRDTEPDVSAEDPEDCPSSSPIKLAQVKYTVSSEHEETLDSLFECSERDLEGGQYIDLLLNPERFTGYAGEPAHRIWRSIYEENCFFKNLNTLNLTPFSLDNVCYEERIFYRAISGLHSSINIHLCASYALMDGTFTHNVKEFLRRFEGKEGYITNLYFLYLLELRALQKSEQYLLSKANWQSSGDLLVTKEAIRNLLKAVRSFKWQFNESTLFKQEPRLAHEFASKFRNITTNIMDCVGCDKCKLWGKVQIHGLGTAFKILITDNIESLHLTRHEITTLVNAVAKLSQSIRHLDTFDKMLVKGQTQSPPLNRAPASFRLR